MLAARGVDDGSLFRSANATMRGRRPRRARESRGKGARREGEEGSSLKRVIVLPACLSTFN
jgi:hypothetical protein